MPLETKPMSIDCMILRLQQARKAGATHVAFDDVYGNSSLLEVDINPKEVQNHRGNKVVVVSFQNYMTEEESYNI